jgi:hypothetical protein
MNVDYPTDEVPTTPEYVLGLLRDSFRLSDEPYEFLTDETTVLELATEWNDTILFWWELAKPLDELLDIGMSIEDWKSALYPMNKRTVRDLCESISSRMGTRQAIRPWHYIGGDCHPAGAFLTTRSILARHGADVSEIKPSTGLEPYFETYGFNWLWELCRLAPGRLPALDIDRWFPTCGCLTGVALGMVPMLLGRFLGKDGGKFWAIGSLIQFFTIFLSLIINRLSKRRYEFGELLTFRDLAYALAGQQPRRRIEPSS